ncbi:MAG: hypothetical protein IJT15_02400 [Rickettsiales bacterium]|nr:hypothetical protein [Rickettsiales bacterium]
MADERFVEQYEEKEKKCKRWKDFIDIKKSIVFCSALGGILGALVGIPAGGAVCGGVMGTNAQDSLKSLVDWLVGPSEDDKKNTNFINNMNKHICHMLKNMQEKIMRMSILVKAQVIFCRRYRKK